MLKRIPLLFAAVAAISVTCFAQYSVSGGGGTFPALGSTGSGAGGTGGGTSVVNALPTGWSTYPLTTPIPAAASNIKSVTLTGLTHTWSGDVQAVLWNPTMTSGYNLVCRLGGVPPNGVGLSTDYNGNYTILAAADPMINQTWPTASATPPLPSGNYPQYYGLGPWTSGSANVFNTDLASIPVVPGTWTLFLYDGAGGDTGSLTGWTITGDTGVSAMPFCFGDGTGTACPCGNNGAAGNGCASSVNPNGANLAASGSASISNDTLSLDGTGLPASSALYFQGTTQIAAGAGAAFGDGLRCAGGTVIRLGTKTSVGGASSYPSGSPAVHVKGGDSAGDVRMYQCWYRNAAAFCTPSTFNLTNGVQITWGS